MPADQTARRQMARALARLVAQARLNEGDAMVAGRDSEAAAWNHVGAYLASVLRLLKAGHHLAADAPLWVLPPSSGNGFSSN